MSLRRQTYCGFDSAQLPLENYLSGFLAHPAETLTGSFQPRSPKILLPIRTIVLPSSMASS